MEEKLDSILKQHEGVASNAIPVLQHVQEEMGYLPEEAMPLIARHVGIPAGTLFGVATFYTMFRFKPVGKNHVCVCRGTACHVRGATQVLEEIERKLDIKEGETTEDGEYSLETVACLGCCALAPVMTVNGNVSGRMSINKVAKTLKAVSQSSEEEE